MVWNRLNPSQLQEQYLNFMADHVLALMKETDDFIEKEDLFFDFIKAVNKEQYDFLYDEYLRMNRSQKGKFFYDIEEKGIFIHQPPFFGNTTDEQFRKIFRSHPEWCTEYKFKNIEKPMTMGDIYFIRLKHEAGNKTSIRSASTLNVKNLPAKSTLKKDHKILISSNPLRLGEMEVSNLLISKKSKIVEKLLKTYSTNEKLREELIKQLLDPGMLENRHIRNTLNMNIDVNLKENVSISREILDKYLNVLGYQLIDDLRR